MRQQEPFVAARQRLQPHVAAGGKAQRLARQIAGFAIGRTVRFQQSLVAQNVRHARHRRQIRRGARRIGRRLVCRQREIQQPMGVVVGRAERSGRPAGP